MMMLAAQTVAASELAACFLFYACAGLTLVSAWAIVLSRNIVRMAVYLLLTLVGVAGLYFLLEAELLAAVQLIVYAGGTLILIVFGVMLTARNPKAAMHISLLEQVAALGIGLLVGAVLIGATLMSMKLAPGTLEKPAGAGGYAKVETLGYGLMTTYLVPFEVAGVLLLVVMIGAAYMARRRAGNG